MDKQHRRQPLINLISRNVLVLAFVALSPVTVYAANFNLPYSGRFVEDNGRPLEGPVDIVVEFYRNDSGGEAISGPHVFSNVGLESGVFQLNFSLPKGELDTITGSGDNLAWIQVVDATNGVTYPRQRMAVSPFALKVPVDGETIGWNDNGKLELKRNLETSQLGQHPVNTSGAAAGQVLTWDENDSTWKPMTVPVGNTFSISDIPTGGITTDKLADAIIIGSKVASGAISQNHLANDSVTETAVADSAVTADKLAADSVTTAKIADSAVTYDKFVHPCSAGKVLQVPTSGSNWTCISVGSGTGDINNNGNAINQPITIGTDDAQPLNLETNDQPAVTIDATGNVGVGTETPAVTLDVAGASGIRAQQICDEAGSNCKDISTGWGGDGTVTSVAMTAATGLSVGGGPVTGDGTFSLGLTNDLAAVEGIPGTGIAVRTGIDTWSTITDNSTNWDLAHADRLKWDGGATGLDAAAGRTSLGLQIGSDVQAYNAQLADVAGLAPTADNFIMGDGTSFGLVTGSAARTALGAAAAGANADITSLTNLNDDSISGDKISAGTIDTFASTGIDDNAAATALTIDATGQVGVGTASPNSPLEVAGMVHSTSGGFKLPDGTVIDDASDIGGSTTSALITNWPDAIVCNTTANGNTYQTPHFLTNQRSNLDDISYRFINNGNTTYQVSFVHSTGAYP